MERLMSAGLQDGCCLPHLHTMFSPATSEWLFMQVVHDGQDGRTTWTTAWTTWTTAVQDETRPSQSSFFEMSCDLQR